LAKELIITSSFMEKFLSQGFVVQQFEFSRRTPFGLI
jgi:hypothetical protein